jgi:hypothetical protein
MKLELSRRIFEKTQISNVTKIRPVGAESFPVEGQTDMTKLTGAFRNFENAPTNLHKKHTTFWIMSVHGKDPPRTSTLLLACIGLSMELKRLKTQVCWNVTLSSWINCYAVAEASRILGSSAVLRNQ